MKNKGLILAFFAFTCVIQVAVSQIEYSYLKSYDRAGKLVVRPSIQIASSTWSVGGETLDRDYADYHAYKAYLGELGAKRLRLQGGWAKCEPAKGEYQFAWLDSIVYDAVSRGVAPWISLSYGNPVYEGGGEAKLAGRFPSSEEALDAWDNWVAAVVKRYATLVYDWEIWNEPDIMPQANGVEYAEFFIRTGKIIKHIQPSAKLYAFGLAIIGKRKYPDDFFSTLQAKNKLHLVDVVTFHGYKARPEDAYLEIEKLEELVRRYVPDVEMMQGENGCPSTPASNSIGALSNLDWTERSQAKWNLRRMLGDFGRGYSTNVFTMSDLYYGSGDHITGYNSKGLLKAFDNHAIERPKIAYYAVQHVMNLFDGDILRRPVKHNLADSFAVFGFEDQVSEGKLLAVWYAAERPMDSCKPITTVFNVDGKYHEPVLVDLISGWVYALRGDQYRVSDSGTLFSNIPLTDYPLVIAERNAVKLTNASL